MKIQNRTALTYGGTENTPLTTANQTDAKYFTGWFRDAFNGDFVTNVWTSLVVQALNSSRPKSRSIHNRKCKIQREVVVTIIAVQIHQIRVSGAKNHSRQISQRFNTSCYAMCYMSYFISLSIPRWPLIKFIAECRGQKFFKICQHFTKLWARLQRHLFDS